MKRVFFFITVLTAILLGANVYAATDVLVDGFEDSIWNANWNGAWVRATNQVHSGRAGAKANFRNDGMFTTVDMNTTSAKSITVDFWCRKMNTDARNDFILYYFNGRTFDKIADLDALGEDNTWLHFTQTITDRRYFKSNFRIRFEARNLFSVSPGMAENVWVDDVKVSMEIAGGLTDNDTDGYNSNVDCNDNDSHIHPGAEDTCGDGIDQDCSGADAVCPECQQFTATNDLHVADGRAYLRNETSACMSVLTYYVKGSDEPLGEEIGGVTTTLYTIDGGQTYHIGTCPSEDQDRDGDGYSLPEDCNDDDGSIHPGALDICEDGIDQDCDDIDPVCPPEDLDKDGFLPPEDCDNNDASIHPGAEDQCGDGIDQNCDGVDPECPLEIDEDNDGYSPPVDCNDNDPGIHPLAEEICGDGIDQNCDGSDLSCGPDMDGDGYGNVVDCNDNDPAIYPGAVEICGDGIDQDCSGYDLACSQPAPSCIRNLGNWKIKFKQKFSNCKSCHTACTPGGHSCAVGGPWGSMNCVTCHSSAHF